MNSLIAEIDERRNGNLSSALRVLVLEDTLHESGKSIGLT
jgi:predicted DNA-binding ribbon-helix-helix protein